MDAASHPSELEPPPPILADQEGEVTHRIPAVKQTYLRNGKREHQHQQLTRDRTHMQTHSCSHTLNTVYT